MDDTFIQWFLTRIDPYREVVAEKLAAEREAMRGQQEHNRNYADFMNNAVLPAVERLVAILGRHGVVHRVSTWGNQLSIRVHLSWRWGELLITQSHEDAVTFEHHIITEGERRNEDRDEEHSHQYDLLDPVPTVVAEQELTFFMSRLAQDLIVEEGPESPPGE